MSSKEEWQKYQDALRRGDPAAAAEAFRIYQEARRREGKGSSRPILVNLSTKSKAYPNAIPVDQIPEELERNPEFFDLMRKVVTKEK